jgi:hypothetical protein
MASGTAQLLPPRFNTVPLIHNAIKIGNGIGFVIGYNAQSTGKSATNGFNGQHWKLAFTLYGRGRGRA